MAKKVDPKNQGALDKYRSMRDPSRTPEPFGGAPAPRGGRRRLFVIQQHDATRMHWDVRFEIGGVLKSWAVPRGPSMDPADKRLAVQTEDHPLEYAWFEGVIPDGNYGAGPSMVWDRGTYEVEGDADQGIRAGKFTFQLWGHKLHGGFELIRTKGMEGAKPQWLMFKRKDAFARPGAGESEPTSVLSGLTIEEVGQPGARGAAVAEELVRLGAPEREVRASALKLMLAETRDAAFSDPEWLFELKYDGYRLLCGKERGAPVMRLRGGGDARRIFPEIARALDATPWPDFLLDGEVVVLADDGKPRFHLLQQRAGLSRSGDVDRAMLDMPATYFAFDLLAFAGLDARGLPLAQRKEVLRKLTPRLGVVRYADHIEGEGQRFYDLAEAQGLEGLIAKKKDSAYVAGRSRNWLKLKAPRENVFSIGGWTPPAGGRSGFGALLVGWWKGKSLICAGRVGTGFDDKMLDTITQSLETRRVEAPPFANPPKGIKASWCKPELRCRVRFTDWTGDEQLRHPVFLGLTDAPAANDLDPTPSVPLVAPPEEVDPLQPRRVVISNAEKLFWPDDGYTKGDLIAYYESIAPVLLPYLRDRPIVLTRFPDGIAGKSFFQKDAPDWTPPWVHTERIWSEETGREVDYYICNDVETLLHVVNSASIPIHVWSARVGSLQNPDWTILDLDPKGAPFAHVVRIARALKKLLDQAELPSFPKTSGQEGMHILVPLNRVFTHEESRALAEVFARLVVEELPDIATVERLPAKRGGKVYVDFLQNGYGKTIVSPFSVRPVKGARVSAPLHWREVTEKLTPAKWTITSAPKRYKSASKDPMAPLLEMKVDVRAALEALTRRLAARK